MQIISHFLIAALVGAVHCAIPAFLPPPPSPPPSRSPDPGSTGNVYGSGAVSHGQMQLNSQTQSGFPNGLPSTYSQSMNNGTGTSLSISGQANSGVTISPVADTRPPVFSGNSGANSNGNAATGVLTNNDQSHGDNTNGMSLMGTSQITANGTGVSVSNSVNSAAAQYPLTTTTPWTTTPCRPLPCPSGCPFDSFSCSCICYDPIIASSGKVAPAAQKRLLRNRDHNVGAGQRTAQRSRNVQSIANQNLNARRRS
ncbi:uncharacterized protein LOC129598090 [Paramacrobiotus metropolitanus]|uniref:uncharacterized protein LOC129598090 n=1 Tax=Paramacrobiotus metropolitanus TaxID=2943436 RepID=UPI002445F707|nr:uncharacterized protein LOC129598090 [Paramacrobiotus metropolitanus]